MQEIIDPVINGSHYCSREYIVFPLDKLVGFSRGQHIEVHIDIRTLPREIFTVVVNCLPSIPFGQS